MGGGDAFGDDDQIFGGFALPHDGATAFIGDSNVVGTNRVAVASIGATTASSLQVINMLTDPSSIVASPFGDVAVVTSAQPPSEGIYVLDKGRVVEAGSHAELMAHAGIYAELFTMQASAYFDSEPIVTNGDAVVRRLCRRAARTASRSTIAVIGSS